MCGIVGLTGADDLVRTLRESLLTLEYRGYDSAGIAIVDAGDGVITRHRSAVRAGAINELARADLAWPHRPGAGIGHTRWATHGAPTDANAHPHLDCSGRVAIVHNGIIENHRELAAALAGAGHVLRSQTDTEVVAHLVEDGLSSGASLLDAVRAAVDELRGDFAIGVVASAEPDTIVVARRTSPLIIGLTERAGLVASDISALLPLTRELYALADDEIAEVRPGKLRIVARDGSTVEPVALDVAWDVDAAQRGGYADFMSKEIHEQPRALADTLGGRFRVDGTTDLEELSADAFDMAAYNRVLYLACGSSYHASLAASLATERFARIASSAEVASEFRYRDPVIDDRTLAVVVSQSGESVDTLHALREARRRGATAIAVTNVVGSIMSREADGTLYTHAGPEIGVASTKCHLAQIALLEAFALHLGFVRKEVDAAELQEAGAALRRTSALVEQALSREAEYYEVARRFAEVNDFYFLGRRTGFPVALEGALKLKELAYVRAEAYPAGEMKHGPIALIEPGAVVVVIAQRTSLWEKIMANVEEMRARGATVVAVVDEGDAETTALVDAVMEVPATAEFCSPIVNAVPLQCFAYAIAEARGNDVDRPRNLAKVVTVE